MLSYGRLTIDFGIVVFAKTRWLFSYGVTFLPDACGTCCFMLSASLCVRKKSNTIRVLLYSKVLIQYKYTNDSQEMLPQSESKICDTIKAFKILILNMWVPTTIPEMHHPCTEVGSTPLRKKTKD